MKNKPGFTLIELLIVIAIIGILASAAMLQYPITVKRVKDSRIMSNLSQFRTRAWVLFEVDKNYSQADCKEDCSCPDNLLKTLCQDSWDNSDETVKVRVNNNGQGFCAVAHLQDYEKYFCIDSAMRAKKYDTSPAASGGACDLSCQAADSCACE